MSDDLGVIADLAPARRRSPQGQHTGPTNDFVAFSREDMEQSIPARFEEIVRRHPGRLAVKAKTEALTYDELNKAANRLAHAILAQRGSKAEPIALLLEKGAPFVAATLGVFKAGKICVPLDPAYPLARIRSMLEDSQPRLVVTNERNAALARDLGQNVPPSLNLDRLDPGLPTGDVGLVIPPEAIAYIMYTSGSTGRPKGVFQSHRNALHDFMLRTNIMHITPNDRLSLLSSPSFISSLRDLSCAVLNGAAVFPFDIQADGVTSLSPWLIEERITIYHSVATVFRHFCATLTGEEAFPSLRLIYVGGETVSSRDVELYKAHFATGCLFLNMLSSSESGAVRHYFLDKATPTASSGVPVGYPLADKEILILSEGGHPVPAGEVGEIAVRSRYLALGYWGRPDLTGAVFLPDPEGGDRRIYRMGDLGHMTSDGCLEHLGRTDFQVKIRGLQVDTAAIETALRGVENIKEAAVVSREGPSGDQRLVAYVVPARPPTPTATALRRALAPVLPTHMIPSTFVMLEALPLTPTSKVDRRALPAPDGARPSLEAAFVPPRTPLEETLAEIWKEVLNLNRVGVQDDFFDLGGDSLLAGRLFLEIARLAGRELPLATLFHAPTIEQLADVLRPEGRAAPWSSLVPIQPSGSRPPLFCAHQHTGHLFCYRDLARHLGPDQPTYGLVPRGLDGRQAPWTRIEEMAAHYAKEIRQLQPEGPYFLAGYCFGGTVAFEIAHQLLAQGLTVGLLALIEASWWGPGPPLRHALQRLRRRIGYEAARLAQFTSPKKVGYVLRKGAVATKEQAARIVSRLHERRREASIQDTYLDLAIRRVEGAHEEAVRQYRPQPYPGRVTHFRLARPSRRHYGDPTWGWGGLAGGGIEICEIPGDRPTIVDEPDVRVLAEKLRACLEAAQNAANRV